MACRPSADDRSDASATDLISRSASCCQKQAAIGVCRDIDINICSSSELNVMTGNG